MRAEPALTIEESFDLLDEVSQFLVRTLQPSFGGIGVFQGGLCSLFGYTRLCLGLGHLP